MWALKPSELPNRAWEPKLGDQGGTVHQFAQAMPESRFKSRSKLETPVVLPRTEGHSNFEMLVVLLRTEGEDLSLNRYLQCRTLMAMLKGPMRRPASPATLPA